MVLPADKNRCTFADILAWDEKEHIEIINGEAVMMAPPSRAHQEISGAPFAVRLFEKNGDSPEDVDTMVEPDISVVCDKRDKHGCKGAPDLIVEILPLSTRRHDRLAKLGLYQRAGVREYWIVSPEEQAVQVFTLSNGLLLPHEVYDRESVAKVKGK